MSVSTNKMSNSEIGCGGINAEVNCVLKANDTEPNETDAGKFGLNQFGLGRISQLVTVPNMPHDEFYNMTHSRSGICIIFSHTHFAKNLELSIRSGNEYDVLNLKQTFKSLGFDVRLYEDLKYGKIRSVLKEVVEDDHSSYDCFALCFMSHGYANNLYAYDVPFTFTKLWEEFTSDNCPALAGKPKLFFIQACQGDRYQDAVHVTPVTSTDSGYNSYKLPTHADFLCAFSTIPGFYSWRSTNKGAWFIQALCEELQKHGTSEDLLSIMTRVNRNVAMNFESRCLEFSGKKQVPYITNTLLRKIVFTQKSH